MFISKNLIEMHKGKIWFKSSIDKDDHGTTFYFSLPVLKEKPFDPHEGEGALFATRRSDSQAKTETENSSKIEKLVEEKTDKTDSITSAITTPVDENKKQERKANDTDGEKDNQKWTTDNTNHEKTAEAKKIDHITADKSEDVKDEKTEDKKMKGKKVEGEKMEDEKLDVNSGSNEPKDEAKAEAKITTSDDVKEEPTAKPTSTK